MMHELEVFRGVQTFPSLQKYFFKFLNLSFLYHYIIQNYYENMGRIPYFLLHRTANILSLPAIPDFNVWSNTCHKIFVIECYSFYGHSNALSLRFTKFCVWAHATHRWLSLSTKVRQNLCMWTILHRLHLFSSGFVKVAKPTFVALRRPSVP